MHDQSSENPDEERERRAAGERLAEMLTRLEPELPDRERLLLHRMVWTLLEPVDRARFSASGGALSEEEERFLDDLATDLGAPR
jgi:hypothetical protein